MVIQCGLLFEKHMIEGIRICIMEKEVKKFLLYKEFKY